MEFLVGFFGGLARILAGLLSWQFKAKTPFDFGKFFQAFVSAAITGAIFQFTLDVDFGAKELLLGWGTSEAVNKGLTITGLGPFVANFVRNAITSLRQ